MHAIFLAGVETVAQKVIINNSSIQLQV